MDLHQISFKISTVFDDNLNNRSYSYPALFAFVRYNTSSIDKNTKTFIAFFIGHFP